MRQHIKNYFEDISEVLFFKKMYFGMAFLILSLCFNWQIFICGFGCSLVGYIYSRMDRTPKILKSGGLLTVNGFFFGIAMASLFKDSIPFYVSLVIGAFIVPIATKAVFEVLQHWKLSPFIVPYILAVWVFYLSADALFFELKSQGDISVGLAEWLKNQFTGSKYLIEILLSLFASMGRVFFLPDPNFGLVLFILVFIASPRKGFYFLAGAASAIFAAFALATNHTMGMELSHYSFSAGLVGLGLAAQAEKFVFQKIFLFCLLSMFLTIASDQFLRHLGLPVLSLPYVLTIWTALLSRSPRLNVSWVR